MKTKKDEEADEEQRKLENEVVKFFNCDVSPLCHIVYSAGCIGPGKLSKITQ